MSKKNRIFERTEKKYKINKQQQDNLLSLIKDNLTPDEHGISEIYSLYLDNKSHLLIRNSLSEKLYKEKLRIRSYGKPDKESFVYFEIKKKFKGVVHKRREKLLFKEVLEYLEKNNKPIDSQIMNEIDYMFELYGELSPSILVKYQRVAFSVKDSPGLRLTFDSKMKYRDDDFFDEDDIDKNISDDGLIILEIKTNGSIPLWLVKALNECNIKPSSFSKVGTAYLDILGRGGNQDA